MFGECTYVFSIELAKHFLSFFIFSSQTLINKKQKFEMLHEKIFRILYIYISFLYSIFWCLWNTTLHSRVAISNYYQCYMLHYQSLIIYVVILWKIWTIVDIDLLDKTNILFGYIIIVGKVFAKSFHHAQVRKWVQVMSENTKWVQGR